MTFDEKAKLKAELAGLSVEALEDYRKMFVRIMKVTWGPESILLLTGVLCVIDNLVAEQDEQPETKDV